MDEFEPVKRVQSAHQLGANLETLSIAELESLVSRLEAEIVRVQSEIARKRAQASAAEGLFKS